MVYATLRSDGWYLHLEDGGDGYLSPVRVVPEVGTVTARMHAERERLEVERMVREWTPRYLLDSIVVTPTWIGTA